MKDYKKILKCVVDIINTTEKSDIGFANICTYIGENCPELKESEDEKIRKELIQYIKDLERTGNLSPNYSKDYIAWLEKQIYTKNELRDMGFAFTTNGDIVTPKEQEKDLKAYLAHEKKKWLEKQEWSEEDEKMLDKLDWLISSVDYCDSRKELSDWLKSLKDRVQPKQEWSEEDENMLNTLIRDIEIDKKSCKYQVAKGICDSQISWLKSLKHRNHWKPSEEQMDALNAIILNGGISYVNQTATLIELYNDLKKLKG